MLALSAGLGMFMGAVVAYWIGRKYGSKVICILFEEKTYRKVENFWVKRGNLYVFLSTFTPLPDAPVIFGSLGMKWKDFLLYYALAKFVAIVLFAYGFFYIFI
jgi:uncharacterized membrane protein YdjX (TVP38/TMEM64 family)